MPNHCINEVVFHSGDLDLRRRVLQSACVNGEVDFGILVPRPLNLWAGDVGSDHRAAFKRTGLDWQTEHWGTKWNAYGQKPPELIDAQLILRFQTAWRPPYPWLAALFNHVRADFDHNWLSEGAETGVHGEFRVAGKWGDEWKEMPADPALHRHLHKLLWGVEEFEDEEDA